MFTLAEGAQVTEVKVSQYRCSRCFHSWTGRKDTPPKLCPSCRQPWDKPFKYRVSTKERNHPYISNRELAHKKATRSYAFDKDTMDRDNTIRAITAIPANEMRTMPCFALFTSNPDYPVYEKAKAPCQERD